MIALYGLKKTLGNLPNVISVLWAILYDRSVKYVEDYNLKQKISSRLAIPVPVVNKRIYAMIWSMAMYASVVLLMRGNKFISIFLVCIIMLSRLPTYAYWSPIHVVRRAWKYSMLITLAYIHRNCFTSDLSPILSFSVSVQTKWTFSND